MEAQALSDKSQQGREAQNNMGGKWIATENVRILLWRRALHVGYTSWAAF